VHVRTLAHVATCLSAQSHCIAACNHPICHVCALRIRTFKKEQSEVSFFSFFFLFSFTSALTITLCGAAYAFTTVFSTASLLPQPAPHHHAVRYSTPAPSTHTAHSILQSQCSVQHHSFLNQHFTITLPTIRMQALPLGGVAHAWTVDRHNHSPMVPLTD
jgi:hypothetical protein